MKYNNLERFKNIHRDKIGICFATGPSLNRFSFDSLPGDKDDYITTGVNDMVFHPTINVDYYFCGDKKCNKGSRITGISFMEQIKEYKKNRLKGELFCTVFVNGSEHPAHFTLEEANSVGANVCKQTTDRGVAAIKKDIHHNDFYNHSIIFTSLQFLLYTGVKKVYLIGCDAGGGGSYLEPLKAWPDNLIEHWEEFKEFIQTCYSDVEVISINPYNLKGWFDRDITFERDIK